MAFKLLNLTMALLFGLSALVQLNDPDPFKWIAIYSVCAITCLMAFSRIRYYRLVPTIVCVICILWAVSLLSEIYAESPTINWAEVIGSVEMISMQSEVVREVGGLLLISVWMLILAIRFRG